MLSVNTVSLQLVSGPTSPTVALPPPFRPVLLHATRSLLEFQLIDNYGKAVALNESDILTLSGDINFLHTDDLCFFSGTLAVAITDAANGKIAVFTDTRTAAYESKIVKQRTTLYIELTRYVSGSEIGEPLLQDYIYASPRVQYTEGTPIPATPGYLTADQIYSLLRDGAEVRFSVDGISFHATQTSADRYYQSRYPGGEWGVSVMLVVGPEGTAATVAVGTVTDLEPGNVPTVENAGTAKDAILNFGLVKGKAATISVDSVDLLEFGTTPYIINDGTAFAAVIRIGIPRAPAVIVQYSADNATWLSAPTADTLYHRFSTDGGATFQTSFRARGLSAIGYVPRGAYSAAATYSIDEMITYNGNLYVSLTDANTGNLPTDGAYWLRVVSGSGQAAITIFSTIAARDAYTPAATGELAFVRDATGDSTVSSGSAEYLWDGINSAWIKIFEAESLDIVLSWANVSSRPPMELPVVTALTASATTAIEIGAIALYACATVKVRVYDAANNAIVRTLEIIHDGTTPQFAVISGVDTATLPTGFNAVTGFDADISGGILRLKLTNTHTVALTAKTQILTRF